MTQERLFLIQLYVTAALACYDNRDQDAMALVQELAERCGYPKPQAGDVYDEIFRPVVEELRRAVP